MAVPVSRQISRRQTCRVITLRLLRPVQCKLAVGGRRVCSPSQEAAPPLKYFRMIRSVRCCKIAFCNKGSARMPLLARQRCLPLSSESVLLDWQGLSAMELGSKRHRGSKETQAARQRELAGMACQMHLVRAVCCSSFIGCPV